MSPDFLADDGTSLLIACPVCRRVIWRNASCHHGIVPTTMKGAPKELPSRSEVLADESKKDRPRRGDRASDPFVE